MAAPNPLDNKADIAKEQEWLGQANIATTRIYDQRKIRPKLPIKPRQRRLQFSVPKG